ncbi:RNA polymerase sigma-54 factor [Rubritalea halochordaticola]|uniref:RNA polymerase sigma-54 factor n=1 Tax=Rubritalea halochordaticola TaxID=714537 RepID=A0ABP9V2A2_9BACT
MAGIDFQQNLSQSQVLSPQMRQSLEILQANSLELGQILQQAIAVNPVLEVTQHDEELPEDLTPDAEYDMETLSELDDDFRELQIMERRTTSTSQDDQERRDHYYNSIVAPETLQQHLLSQLEHSINPEKIKTAGREIIGNIDDRGFLSTTLENMAISSALPLQDLEKALAVIQNFDPAGVGASDLAESLLIQLHKRGYHGTLETRIVQDFLNDLARKRYPEIARKLGVSTSSITQAAETIATLTPDPGAEFDPTSNPYITPDVIIKKNADGEWEANLTNDNIPDVAISNAYKDLMASTHDSKARQYLRDQIRDGKVIIRSISQRQDTLLKLANELIKRQSDYFAKGPRSLKPLTMNEVADVIGVHSATISRAVAGKYVLTPHGLVELRTFFTSGYETKDGQQVSNTGVRDTIQEMIANENPKKPLSDSALEKMLKEKGLKVARRTIAKYRDQLNILPSHLRKQF